MKCSVCEQDAPEIRKPQGEGVTFVAVGPHTAPCGQPCDGGEWVRARDGERAGRHGGPPPKDQALTTGAGIVSWCPRCGLLDMLHPQPGRA